jgi:hypothetical protein
VTILRKEIEFAHWNIINYYMSKDLHTASLPPPENMHPCSDAVAQGEKPQLPFGAGIMYVVSLFMDNDYNPKQTPYIVSTLSHRIAERNAQNKKRARKPRDPLFIQKKI